MLLVDGLRGGAGRRRAAVLGCDDTAATCGHLASASRTCSDRGQDLTCAQVSAEERRVLRLWSEGVAKTCGRLAAFDEDLTSSLTLKGSWNS